LTRETQLLTYSATYPVAGFNDRDTEALMNQVFGTSKAGNSGADDAHMGRVAILHGRRMSYIIRSRALPRNEI
jgi:hypothetical protein